MENPMTTCRHVQMSYFPILSPRWHDRKVLLASRKVKEHNKIVFTGKDGASMGEEPYYISGKELKKSRKESNGVIPCYAVDLDKLQQLTYTELCEHLY